MGEERLTGIVMMNTHRDIYDILLCLVLCQ